MENNEKGIILSSLDEVLKNSMIPPKDSIESPESGYVIYSVDFAFLAASILTVITIPIRKINIVKPITIQIPFLNVVFWISSEFLLTLNFCIYKSPTNIIIAC